MNISRQIGWSQESNLLYQILKQLNKLTSIMFGLKPKYKVYTALVTQSGTSDLQTLSSGAVTKGVTYYITDASDGDFSNVGAPSNDDSTYFVATNDEVPNSYGSALLRYDTGAPVVTVLENTIGNIWFTYISVGYYEINSIELFTTGKTFIPNVLISNNPSFLLVDSIGTSTITILINKGDDALFNTPIEIRVYN